jgi:hypothetical protein
MLGLTTSTVAGEHVASGTWEATFEMLTIGWPDSGVYGQYIAGSIVGWWSGSESAGDVYGEYSADVYDLETDEFLGSGEGTVSGTYSTLYDPATGVMTGDITGEWLGLIIGSFTADIGINIETLTGTITIYADPFTLDVPSFSSWNKEFEGSGAFDIVIFCRPPAPIAKDLLQIIDGGDGDGIIEVNEPITFMVVITATNTLDSLMTDAIVWDRFGGELSVALVSVSRGTVDIITSGETEKVHLKWTVGDLAVGSAETLVLQVSTDLNPVGHQEYTEPGIYELNSGCVLKAYVEGKKVSFETDPITIEVFP